MYFSLFCFCQNCETFKRTHNIMKWLIVHELKSPLYGSKGFINDQNFNNPDLLSEFNVAERVWFYVNLYVMNHGKYFDMNSWLDRIRLASECVPCSQQHLKVYTKLRNLYILSFFYLVNKSCMNSVRGHFCRNVHNTSLT